MKKFSTLLVSSLFSLSLLAGDGSRLSISTISRNMDMKIEVDGRRLNMQDNSITLSNLSEGTHSVRIYRDKKRNGYSNGNGKGFGFDKKQDIIYAGSVFVKRGFHTDILVNRFGKVFIDERRINRIDDGYDQNDDYDGSEWDNGYGNVMSARDFDMVKEQIRKEWYESSRLISVKTIIDKNNFTVQQVKEMMLLFTFENNRLDVAKYAYRRTVDQRNYYQLNDAFTFSSSRDELARFIRDAR